MLLGWMVAGLLLSETVCFDRWTTHLPLGYWLASSWQRWLANSCIDVEALYGPLILWAVQHWQNPGQALHLALDTTIALLEKVDRLLNGFGAITLLADRAFPCDELIAWFRGRSRWSYVMRLRGDTEIHGTAAPLGCQVRRFRLQRGECRGFRGVQLWADGSQTVNLVIAHPTGLPVEEPWFLISSAEPSLDLVWSYAQRFCCEQWSAGTGEDRSAAAGGRHRCAEGSLQGYALSQVGLRRQVDPHWKRGMSFLRIGLAALQMAVADAAVRLMAWLPIPIQELEPCIPSRKEKASAGLVLKD